MDIKYITRLENNHYALHQAFIRLSTTIETVDIKLNDQEIYAATGEMLLWVVTTEEWHLRHEGKLYITRRNNDKNGVLLKGIRHAYNMLKHNMDFIKIHEIEGGFSFPITFPFKSPSITVHWSNAGNLLEGEYKNQKQNYIKYIEGEELLPTFVQVKRFLEKEHGKYRRI